MKQIILLLALSISCSAFAQQAFSKVKLKQIKNREYIVFNIPNETNVRHYRIEASEDSLNFEVIATIQSKGNSMLGRTYQYDISSFDHQYYRVAKVQMDWSMPYSAIVTKNGEKERNIPAITTGALTSNR